MATFPNLNYDILLEVMKACPRPDCARFMRTARFFYTHGIEALLSQSIHVNSEDILDRLLIFLRMQDTKRFRYVRLLHFSTWALTESTALELAAALPLMTELRELSISNSEDFLYSHPKVPEAVSALTSLRDLSLAQMGVNSIGMLQSLRSKLVYVSLDLDVGYPFAIFQEDEEGWPRHHVAALLAGSQSTLEESTVNRWFAFPDSPPDPTFVFPRMRQLILRQALRPPLAMSYIRTYPKLARLVFETGNSDTWRTSDIDGVRHRNVFEQVESGCVWEALDQYKGSLVDLYVLGLGCPIECLHLSGMDPRDLHMLDPVLSCARPRQLTLPEWPWKLHDPASDVFASFRGQGSSRLQILDMKCGLQKGNSDLDVAAALESLLSALAVHAPLKELRLKIVIHVVDPWPSDPMINGITMRSMSHGQDSPLSEPPLHYLAGHPLAERSADGFDTEDYVRRFAAAVPTLRRVDFYLRGPRHRHRKVTLADGQVQLEETW